jgi:hypothetical protein
MILTYNKESHVLLINNKEVSLLEIPEAFQEVCTALVDFTNTQVNSTGWHDTKTGTFSTGGYPRYDYSYLDI